MGDIFSQHQPCAISRHCSYHTSLHRSAPSKFVIHQTVLLSRINKTRSSADADKPARRVYSGYGFLLVFYRNFKLSPTRTVFEIFAFSNTVTLKSGSNVTQGHHSIERIWLPVNVLWLYLVSLLVSEIFNVEKCCDLEIWVKGHSRSLRVVSFDRLCMVSY